MSILFSLQKRLSACDSQDDDMENKSTEAAMPLLCKQTFCRGRSQTQADKLYCYISTVGMGWINQLLIVENWWIWEFGCSSPTVCQCLSNLLGVL